MSGSTDPTSAIVERMMEKLQKENPDISYKRKPKKEKPPPKVPRRPRKKALQ